MIDLEKEKLKNKTNEKQANIKKEHIIIDSIKKDLTETTTDVLWSEDKKRQIDVMKKIMNYMETTKKIYDPDYCKCQY